MADAQIIRQAKFARLSEEDGLASFRVYSVAQDRQGFLWIGTLDGLDRYDGNQIRHFRHVESDSTSISHDQVRSVLVDRAGIVWAGTDDGGLNSFDNVSEEFTRYVHDPRDRSSITKGAIRVLYEDRGGSLWIGTLGGGIDRMVTTGGPEKTDTGGSRSLDESGNLTAGDRLPLFVHYRHNPSDPGSLSDDNVYSMFEDDTGSLWIGTENGLNVFDRRTDSFRHYFHEKDNPRSLSSSFVRTVFRDGAGTLWVGTDGGGLNRFQEATGHFTHFLYDGSNPNSISGNDVTSIFERDSNRLLIGTLEGLCMFDRRTGTFVRFLPDRTNPMGMPSDMVRSIYRDRSGNIWIATENGLAQILPRLEQFLHYRHQQDGLRPQTVLSILETSMDRDSRLGTERAMLGNALWIGTEIEGLKRIESATGRVTIYRHNPHLSGSLPADQVRALFQDRSGTLWIGTYGGGLARFESTTGRFIPFEWGPNTRNFAVSAFCEDHQGFLWVGTLGDGLQKFDRSTHQFHHYREEPDNPLSLSNNSVFAILEDSEANLWIATEGGGLNRFDRKENTFVHFQHNPLNPHSINNDRVYGLHEDKKGRMWVSTAGGLSLFDRNTGRFTPVIGKDSTHTPLFNRITEDQRGSLWLTTLQEGVFRFDPETWQYRNYGVWDGLQGRGFTETSFVRPNGEIILAGDNGFNIFHPDSIRDNSAIPEVVLTSFKIFDKPVRLDSSLSQKKHITLNYDQNYFSFEFAALDFTVPEKNQYAYRLEGLEKDWVFPAGRRFAGYTNIDPGEYVFRVKGSNSDGVWNQQGASVRLTITPPYWATWWFRTIIGAAMLSLIAGAYNYRVSKLLEMERMRVRIASDLHDDIGSSLSGIALITDSVRRQLPMNEREQNQLADVSHAARHTADALRDIVWLVKPEHDKLDDIVLRMKDSTAKLLVNMEYVFHCDGSDMATSLSMEFRRHLLLIYKEVLNNIAKHSHATKVEISIHLSDNVLQLCVRDNGVGFDESNVQHGSGLNNLRKRAAEIGASIQFTSTSGQGTSVLLRATLS